VSTGRICNLYRVSLLCGDSVELRARRGKSLRKVPVALCATECQVFCEEEFGVEYEAKISDMWIPRDSGVLKLEWARDSGVLKLEWARDSKTAFSK